MKNLLIAQSGGPTGAINATLAGILSESCVSPAVGKVYGARYGIQGVLNEDFVDLGQRISELAASEFSGEPHADGVSRVLHRLAVTPSAALGSCRVKLKDPAIDPSDCEKIVRILKHHEISGFIYIGGNDSMDTVLKLSRFIQEHKIEDLTVVGAPKTIDNDLFGIDHCPGFGSAAKYISTTFSELERELLVYNTPYVIIVEMMGRNAGWLTAAAALSKGQNSDTPYLLYLEEVPFDFSSFLADVRSAISEHRKVLVAVSEGIRDRSGNMIFESMNDGGAADAFGHKTASGVGKILENAVSKSIGCKVRSIELNILQRCAGHLLSETDITESRRLGANAVRLVLAEKTGQMSSLRRISNHPYTVEYNSVDVQKAADQEKKVPSSWILPAGNGVTQECLDYLRPLIQGETQCDYENGIPKYITF